MNPTMNPITDAEKVYWYELALEAIAQMKVNEALDTGQLAALCIAIAKVAIEHGKGNQS